MNNNPNIQSLRPLRTSTNFRRRLAALATLALLGTAVARAEDAATATETTNAPAPVAVTAPAAPPSRVHALLNFEFSDKYVTPRGMIVQDSGLVFQPLVLGFFNLYSGDSFVKDATLVGGVWNCFGTDRIPSSSSGSSSGTSWYEIDPIAGLSFGLDKGFKVDLTYTAFDMQILNIPLSQNFEARLSFDDSPYLKAFAIHPYFLWWKELQGKAVVDTDANPAPSYYFEVGAAPSWTWQQIDLKLEAPVRVLLPNEKFYGTGAGPNSTVGLYEVGIKGTIPLKFMPAGYGNWSCHLGGKFMNFEDENISATQGQSDVWMIYGGISTFF